MNGLRAQWLACSDFLAARGLSATPAARAAVQRVLSQGGPPATERACDKSYAMPFALAMLFVLFLAATASAQSVLDDKGRVYPCVPYEPNCAFPSAATMALRSASISQAHSAPALGGASGTRARSDPLVHAGGGVTPFPPARRPRWPKTLRSRHLLKRAAAVAIQPHLRSKSRRARNGQREATVAMTVGKVATSASWRLRR